MNLDSHLETFVRDGYTVFPAVHSPALMQRWREAYAPLCQAASLPGQPPVAWLSELLECAPALFLPMVAHPLLLDFAEAVMGPFVQLDSTAFNLFPSLPAAQAEGRVNGWHRDRYACVPQTRDYLRPWCINTITYLQDLSAATGPLRVIAGSHRDPVVFSADERGRPHARERLLEPRAGDVVVTHGLLAHAGTPKHQRRATLLPVRQLEHVLAAPPRRAGRWPCRCAGGRRARAARPPHAAPAGP